MSSWQTIVGHQWAVEALRQSIQHGRVGHAYLLSGPANIGKTTLAVVFAMALNCVAEQSQRPCGHCRSCRLIEANRHPDVTVVEPQTSKRGTQQLKIDDIRELQRRLQLAPIEGRVKVAILTDFDAANINAANAFLKTLEEPPSDTVIVLTTGDSDELLQTIRSRCRTFRLRPIAERLIYDALRTRRQLGDEQARILSRVAGGRLGWALQAVDEPELLKARNDWLELLDEVLLGDVVERFKIADRLAKQPEMLGDILNIWQAWWRDMLLQQHAVDQKVLLNIDRQRRLSDLGRSWSTESVQRALDQTRQALWQLSTNANTRLVLENLMLSYPRTDA